MWDKKQRNTVIVIIASVSLVVVVLVGMAITESRSGPVLAEDECTTQNNCVVLPINGSRYLATGEAYEAFQRCSSGISCTWQTVNGTMYVFEGEAYEAYLVLDNLAVPLHRIRYDSQYIGDRPYLINIDGPTPAVEEIVSKYDLARNGTKVSPDSRWTSFYGWIYKENLIRFLNENSVDSLSSKSVTVAPIGSYSIEQGVTVYGIPAQIPDEEQFLAERQAFINTEIAKIISEKEGVKRIDEKDLTEVENDDSASKEFG
ncbi:MAG: hypothetical protein ACRD5H_06195 [Nitrososphaerales archaeon]